MPDLNAKLATKTTDHRNVHHCIFDVLGTGNHYNTTFAVFILWVRRNLGDTIQQLLLCFVNEQIGSIPLWT